jgi:ribosomal protein L6P/L9E
MRVIENTEKLDHNVLELKVGYSHLKLLRFSSDIKIKIVKKTRIIIESLNKVKLGNFAKEV